MSWCVLKGQLREGQRIQPGQEEGVVTVQDKPQRLAEELCESIDGAHRCGFKFIFHSAVLWMEANNKERWF